MRFLQYLNESSNEIDKETFLNILSTKCKENFNDMKNQNIFLFRRR